MKEQKLDGTQSLALITEMINNTRTQLLRNSGRPFLIWGYVTVAVALSQYFIRSAGMAPIWSCGWFAIPVLGCALMWFTRNSDAPRVSNHIDRIITAVWTVFGIAPFFALAISAFYHVSILLLVVLLMGMGVAITGVIIRYKPVIAAGFGTMCASLLFIWFKYNTEYTNEAILLFAAIFVVMMIIPGHILNYKASKFDSCSPR